ncbi:hypothetical protein BDN70DRAFT_898376 [Pholiota conissans]|uniref:Uncharacterized protein n=1 Tax=Pholiota conissans TaxID=109636 RepID=A0A9P5YWH6_9AGAR|nr:hypothetical protein BDN70DRAFT_898376 [Pholiota conissans]
MSIHQILLWIHRYTYSCPADALSLRPPSSPSPPFSHCPRSGPVHAQVRISTHSSSGLLLRPMLSVTLSFELCRGDMFMRRAAQRRAAQLKEARRSTNQTRMVFVTQLFPRRQRKGKKDTEKTSSNDDDEDDDKENISMDYVECEDGTTISANTAKVIRSHAHAVLIEIDNHSTMKLPGKWTKIGVTEHKFFIQEMYAKFPFSPSAKTTGRSCISHHAP